MRCDPAGRDLGLLPFSVVLTDAAWPNGVSGGPVVDETGAVVGVVSAGLDPAVEGGAWESYVGVIAPLLQLSGLLVDPISGAEQNIRLGELARDEAIAFDLYDSLDITDAEDGRVVVCYRFPRWKRQEATRVARTFGVLNQPVE